MSNFLYEPQRRQRLGILIANRCVIATMASTAVPLVNFGGVSQGKGQASSTAKRREASLGGSGGSGGSKVRRRRSNSCNSLKKKNPEDAAAGCAGEG